MAEPSSDNSDELAKRLAEHIAKLLDERLPVVPQVDVRGISAAPLPPDRFGPTKQQIIRLRLEERTVPEIARILNLSVSRVEQHIRDIWRIDPNAFPRRKGGRRPSGGAAGIACGISTEILRYLAEISAQLPVSF